MLTSLHYLFLLPLSLFHSSLLHYHLLLLASFFPTTLILDHLLLLQIHLFLVFLPFYKIIFFLNLYLTLSVAVCHRLHVIKSIFCHQHVSCLAKPIVLTADTVTDTLNVCNVVKYVSSTHNVRKVFPSTHNSINIPRHVYCPENNSNIANSHLPLTNLLSSSETKSSTSSLTSNLNFSEYTLSLPEISCSRICHHVSSSVKFSLFL